MSIGMEGCGPNPRTYSKAEYDALRAEAEALREERDSFQREGIRAMEDLEAARGLLREIRPMIAKSPVSDWFARRDALLTATPAQEVTAGGPYASLAEALAQRYPKPSLLKDCNVTYSNSSRPLADQGERQEAVARVGMVPGTDFKSLDFFKTDLQELPVGTMLYTTPQPGPDVRGLVDDLVFLADYIWRDSCGHTLPNYLALGRYPLDVAKAALAAHRQAQRKGDQP